LIGSFSVAADHPALSGHFPGDPLAPGVVLLDGVWDVIARVVGREPDMLVQAKFLAPVRGGEEIVVALDHRRGRGIGFVARRGEEVVLRGVAGWQV